MSSTVTEERQSLLNSGRADGSAAAGYGTVSQTSPRLCLVFNDSYLGGKRAEWLARLKAFGFEIEQTSPNYVAIAAPDQMIQTVAAQKGSHGQHTMPATRERVLHLLLSEFDPTLAGFLEVPGPFSKRTKKVRLSPELEEAGLVGWFWLHNQETATAIAPRYAWSGFFGLSRQPLSLVRDYFGSEIAWYLLQMNFVARWMAIPAIAGGAYTYFMGLTYLQTGSFDNQFFPIFSGGLALYGLAMLFFWTRLKARYETKWHEDVRISGREDLNTDADLEERVDAETGEVLLHYPEWKHRLRLLATLCIMALPLALVIGTGLGALDVRARIMAMEPPLYGGILSGAVTAVLLFVVVRVVCFPWGAVLTHFENHATRSGYQYGVASKQFALETVAHLLPILYLALLNYPLLSRFAPANEPSIIDALTVQASAVFLAWWLCAAAVSSAKAWRWQTRAQGIAEELGAEGGRPDFNHREQAGRPRFGDVHESAAWLSLQLLYTLVLGACCPLAPVLTYLWVMQRLHWDKASLVFVFQRPHPQPAPSPGFWPDSLQLLVLLALAVQIPLILFCTRAVEWWAPGVTLEERWGLLGALEVCVAALATYLLARTLRPSDASAERAREHEKVVMV